MQILIIDDHPTIIEGYKGILYSNYSQESLSISIAYNCEEAFDILSKSNKRFDIVLLDLALPPFEPGKIFSGEDLSVLIKKTSEDTKIMMLTSHTEALILYNLIKKHSPEALLIKSDFKTEEFLMAFKKVINGEIYYSQTAQKSLKNVGMLYDGLDSYDHRIISLLSKGIKTKNLPDHLSLTISAIDKRKAKIKMFFDIHKGNDEDIIREAKKRGLV